MLNDTIKNLDIMLVCLKSYGIALTLFVMSGSYETEMLTRGFVAQVVKFVFLCRVPVLSRLIILVYAKIMKADFYGHDVGDFDCLLSFFLRSRDLSVKMRGQDLVDGFVSPAEGKIVFWDKLSHNDTMPIKGAGFTVSKLLGRDAPHFQTGAVIYLSPGNYHHVHAPIDLVVEDYYELPGKLESVAPAMIKKFPQLFAENLRQVILAKTRKGASVAIVLVGAKNVGSIQCPKLAGWEPGMDISFAKGEALGFFSLGSTVVMLLDEDIPSPVEINSSVDVIDLLFIAGDRDDASH